MGCGRSKHNLAHPRLVKTFKENNFSDVIKEDNQEGIQTQMGFLRNCCRRSQLRAFRNPVIDDINLEEFSIEDLTPNDGTTTKLCSPQQLSKLSMSPLRDSINVKTSNHKNIPKFVSISSIDIVQSFSEGEEKEDLRLSSKCLMSDNKDFVQPEVENNLPVTPLRLASNFVYDDQDYKGVITEYSSEHLLKLVQENFDPPYRCNLISVTGIGYQYIQEIYRKYPPNKNNKITMDSCLQPILQDPGSISLGTTDLSKNGSILLSSGGRFSEDSESRTSGFMSNCPSINDSLNVTNEIKSNLKRITSCPNIA